MYKLEKTEPFSGVQLEMEGRKFYWRAIDISDETFVKRNSERPDKIILDIHYDDLAKILHVEKQARRYVDLTITAFQRGENIKQFIVTIPQPIRIDAYYSFLATLIYFLAVSCTRYQKFQLYRFVYDNIVHNDIDVIRLDSLHPDFDVLCSYFFIATDDKNNALYISFVLPTYFTNDYGLTQSHKSTFVARTSKYFETNDAIWIVQGQDIIILDKATGKMEKKQIDILTAEEIIELSKEEGD